MPVFLLVLMGVCCVGRLAQADGGMAGGGGGGGATEAWLVMFKAGTEKEEAEEMLRGLGVDSFRWVTWRSVLVVRVELEPGERGAEIRRKLSGLDRVAAVEPDLTRRSNLKDGGDSAGIGAP